MPAMSERCQFVAAAYAAATDARSKARVTQSLKLIELLENA